MEAHYKTLYPLVDNFKSVSCFAIFIAPSKYDINTAELIKNFICYEPTYYAEMWFLFPFVILSLLAPLIFKLMRHINVWLFLLLCLIIKLDSSWIIVNYSANVNHYYIPHNLLDTGRLLFDFATAAAACFGFFDVVKSKCTNKCVNRNFIWGGGVVSLFIFKYLTSYALVGYEFLLVTLIFISPRHVYIDNILAFLGSHSMNMWMIHSWYCYYLFHDELYSLKKPIIIFIVLVVISLLKSILIEGMLKYVSKFKYFCCATIRML